MPVRPPKRAFPPIAVLALALSFGSAPPARAATAPFRAIAIAEDQRRWADGELRGFLSHQEAMVRARAVRAVGRLQDTASVAAVLPLLHDGSAGVRREAVFALGQIGHRSARVPLIAALVDPDTGVVDLAIEALGKLGDRAATPHVVPFLDAPGAARRGAAAVALWRLADSTAAEALIAHLSDPAPAVRWRVVYALEKLPSQSDAIREAVLPLLGDHDPLVRAHAARTLGRVKAKGATTRLFARLREDEPAVMVQAIRAAQLVADSVTAGQLPVLAALVGHADPAVRVTAATALAERFAWTAEAVGNGDGAQAAGDALQRGLTDPDEATRGACARALIARRGSAGLQMSAKVLSDTSVYARVAALDGLRQRGDASLAAVVLRTAFAPGRPRFERMTAAEVAGALAARTHSHALDPMRAAIREGLAGKDLLVAAACAGALADFGDSASVPRLAALYAAHAKAADADARISMRDALRQIAGAAFADSVERADPAPAAAVRYASDFETEPRERGAILHTSAGDIEWVFDPADAPQTVRNFVTLARRGYFDGLHVHRVVPDFVIQDGDPTGTGSGGPGYTIRCEYNMLRYEAGAVGMALSGKDTGGSQWFVTLSPQPHLDGKYTIFAHVVRGLEVAKRVTQGAVVRKVEILK